MTGHERTAALDLERLDTARDLVTDRAVFACAVVYVASGPRREAVEASVLDDRHIG